MLTDSLSHWISVVQATWPVGEDTRVERVTLTTRAVDADALGAEIRLAGEAGVLDGRLELVRCTTQPRPAWIEIDGHRAERLIRLPEYAISLAAGGTEVGVDDPLGTLVYRFADSVREASNERIERDATEIRQRARLYRDIVAAW
jgi:hypothetical protein